MATTPDTSITTKIAADYSWLKTHVILLALVVCLTFGGVYGFEALVAKHDAAKSAELQTIAQTMEKSNEATQQQNAQTIATITQQNAVLQQQINSLLSSISSRDNGLAQQQKSIRVLAPPELSAKWGSVANEPAPSIDNSGNFIVPLPLALKSTDALLAVPVLQADVADDKTIIAKQVQELSSDNTALASELKAHQSDNATCVADKNALNGQITSLKSDARKSKAKWFGLGILIGLVGGHWL
jgi:septal ring factor EnvC (AmiA/AmiB activator)